MPHTCLHHDCERLLACPRQASACALCVTHSLCAPLCCPAVTGQHADDDQIEQMIESGESEMIFQKARARTGGGGGGGLHLSIASEGGEGGLCYVCLVLVCACVRAWGGGGVVPPAGTCRHSDLCVWFVVFLDMHHSWYGKACNSLTTAGSRIRVRLPSPPNRRRFWSRGAGM